MAEKQRRSKTAKHRQHPTVEASPFTTVEFVPPPWGSVTVGAGIRMSGVQYQSANFDISLTMPVQDGETPKEAIQRVDALVAESLGAKTQVRMEQLYSLICSSMQTVQEQKRSLDR